jgi:integrase/recombinase XerD
MLKEHANRYVSIRQALGFKLHALSRGLQAFASFAEARGDNHVTRATAMAWVEQATSPGNRSIRLQSIVQFARFLHAENPINEIPSRGLYPASTVRLLPYIYTPREIERLLEAAGRLYKTYDLRRETYSTLLGLIAATGMRISEALGLQINDLGPDGTLRIRNTKFGKSRLIPLHPTAMIALSSYLKQRRKLFAADNHMFLSGAGRRIKRNMANYTFRRVAKLANIASSRKRPCRIHDLRHTFATRSLEMCPTERDAVARHFVALATYVGHSDIKHTYWYLEATPDLLSDIAAAAELIVSGDTK